jgi:hypothetical protein
MTWLTLSRNHGCARAGNLLFFDTETNPEPLQGARVVTAHRLKLGVAIALRVEAGAVTRREVCRFRSADEFWTFVDGRLRAREPLWLWAHNIGFDLTILGFWERVDRGDWLFPRLDKSAADTEAGERRKGYDNCFLCLQDPPTIVKALRPGAGKAVFLDTLNFWMCPLAAIGRAIGHKKLKMPQPAAPLARWWRYCERDVEIVERAVLGLQNWIAANDLGNQRYTAAGQAMAAFRHRFMEHDICSHGEPEATAIERAGYYGGQSECYFIGTVHQQVTELDVTALYPSVMRSHEFPVKLRYSRKGTEAPDGQPEPPYENLIADVLISGIGCCYPKRLSGITAHCQGLFRTTLTGPELVRAVGQGHIKHWYAWNRYDLAPIFSEHVAWFWKQRAKHKAAGEALQADLCKLLANSLYGKFGQREAAWIDCTYDRPFERWSKWIRLNWETNSIECYRAIGSNVQKAGSGGEHKGAFPAVSAFVTAYARERMRALRQTAGWRNCYYQAIDALYVNDSGLKELTRAGEVIDSEPGKLRICFQGPSAEFRGLNILRVGDRYTRGPLHKSAIRIGGGLWQQENWERLPSIVDRQPDGTVRVSKVLRSLADRYRHGSIGPDGWTRPLLLDESSTSSDGAEASSA